MGLQKDTSATHDAPPGRRCSVAFACELTKNYGTPQSATFRTEVFELLPRLASDLAFRYRATVEKHDYIAANQRLLDAKTQLTHGNLNLADDDCALRKFAKSKADQCRKICEESLSPQSAAARCIRLLNSYEFPTKNISNENDLCATLARFSDYRWWIRRLRVQQKKIIDTVYKDICLVNKYNGKYTADFTLKLHQQHTARNQLYLEQTI